MSKINTPIAVKKSYRDGCVNVAVILKGWGHGDRVKIDGSVDIPVAQARELAASLIQRADEADAKTAARAKHEENRRKYREREIAAGRLIVMKGSPF